MKHHSPHEIAATATAYKLPPEARLSRRERIERWARCRLAVNCKNAVVSTRIGIQFENLEVRILKLDAIVLAERPCIY